MICSLGFTLPITPTFLKPSTTSIRFNRFSRPDARSSLLQKILNKGRPGNKANTLSLQEQQERKEQQEQEDELTGEK